MSARNRDMAIWILNCAAAPVNLLNEENEVSPNSRILPIINKSTRSKHIFNEITQKAQRMCINRSEAIGAGSPIFVKNPFISWIGACTGKSGVTETESQKQTRFEKKTKKLGKEIERE